MNKRQHITSFYLETLLLISVFIAIILVLTQVFGLGRAESGQAKLLTNSVSLAQNAAEAVSAAGGPDDLAALLDEGGNTSVLPDGSVEARYTADMRADPDGSVCVTITWQPDGALVTSAITVRYGDSDEPIYELLTAVTLREGAQ